MASIQVEYLMVYVDIRDQVQESYIEGNQQAYEQLDGKDTLDVFPALGRSGWIMCGIDNKHSNRSQEVTAYWFYRDTSEEHKRVSIKK